MKPQSIDEVQAFSHFSTANDLAEALSPSSKLFPEAVRAVEAIAHIRRPLTSQFGGHPAWRSEKAPLAVLCQHHLNEDLRFLAQLALGLAAGEKFDNMLEPQFRLRQVHEGSPPVSKVGIQNLKDYFPGDFLVYGFLISHCVQQRSSELGLYIGPDWSKPRRTPRP